MTTPRWKAGEPIGSQERLVNLLDTIQQQALHEGLRYEPAVLTVRRRAVERLRDSREPATT